MNDSPRATKGLADAALECAAPRKAGRGGEPGEGRPPAPPAHEGGEGEGEGGPAREAALVS